MVADSITDSELFHGSPISRDFAKKRKANWLWKLKHLKIDAPRRQWISQWKKTNVGEDENGRRLQSLLDKVIDKEAWRIDDEERSDGDDDETDLERIYASVSSPKSVLKSKDFVSGDCFCCSKPMKEEDEDVFDDALDDFNDEFNVFVNDNDESTVKREEDPNPSTIEKSNKGKPETLLAMTSTHNKSRKKKKSKKQECDEKSDCPICSEPMDETDLKFKPCTCGFQLCLFCYNKISKEDARCPACRKKYEKTSDNSGQVSFQQRGRSPIRLSPSFKGLDRA
ncbi:hypothetical protein V5N11_025208 [Cardamine amara subsp. amara]|uniref:RING-type domain-containing protein n=1 Tax=Cardamine amara subsp. amara TaxID=228776 RepID=A0ABD1BI37_CARAN